MRAQANLPRVYNQRIILTSALFSSPLPQPITSVTPSSLGDFSGFSFLSSLSSLRISPPPHNNVGQPGPLRRRGRHDGRRDQPRRGKSPSTRGHSASILSFSLQERKTPRRCNFCLFDLAFYQRASFGTLACQPCQDTRVGPSVFWCPLPSPGWIDKSSPGQEENATACVLSTYFHTHAAGVHSGNRGIVNEGKRSRLGYPKLESPIR